MSRYLWQLRYELLKFGLRPNASGAGAHAPLRAQRKREFGDVVAVGRIEDDQQIAVARRKIDLLDLNSHFLGQILSGFGSLGSILDRTDTLVGPVERTHERGHAVLRVATQRHRVPPRRRSSTAGLRSVMETPKKRRSSERSRPPTALSLPVDPNGISARSVTKGQLIKMLHRSPSGRKAGKERRARARNSHPACLYLSEKPVSRKEPARCRRADAQNTPSKPMRFVQSSPPISGKVRSNSRSLRGPRSSLGTVQIN